MSFASFLFIHFRKIQVISVKNRYLLDASEEHAPMQKSSISSSVLCAPASLDIRLQFIQVRVSRHLNSIPREQHREERTIIICRKITHLARTPFFWIKLFIEKPNIMANLSLISLLVVLLFSICVSYGYAKSVASGNLHHHILSKPGSKALHLMNRAGGHSLHYGKQSAAKHPLHSSDVRPNTFKKRITPDVSSELTFT